MNRLPQVLQNEIWEYVRGDRVYWKQIYSNIINEFFPAFRDERPPKILFVSKALTEKSFGIVHGIYRPMTIFLRRGQFVGITPPLGRDQKWGIGHVHRDHPENFQDFQDARRRVLEILRHIQHKLIH